MNEVVLFPADQAARLSAAALETKGLPSHCHHSWKPAFSNGAKQQRLNTATAPPAENDIVTQFHYMQHKEQTAVANDISKEDSPPPLPSCYR